MTDKELAERITRVGERAKSNSHRIEKLEKQHEAIFDLARSVAVMADSIGALSSAVKGVEEKVCALEKKPTIIFYIVKKNKKKKYSPSNL